MAIHSAPRTARTGISIAPSVLTLLLAAAIGLGAAIGTIVAGPGKTAAGQAISTVPASTFDSVGFRAGERVPLGSQPFDAVRFRAEERAELGN